LQTRSQSDAAVTVGIDIGTTSVKAVAVGGAGDVLARARFPHPIRVPSPGRLEHDAVAAWWEGPRRALAALRAQLGASADSAGRAPVAVAVSAMAPTIAAVDPEGRPIGAGVLYDDERARSGGVPGRVDPTRSLETIELLGWAAGAFPAAHGYWPAQAVANRSLGGRAAVDIGTAFSAGPLFGADGWDLRYCAEAGVDRSQLPEVVMFGEAIGELDAVAPGTVVVAGGVDAFCEQLVAGGLAVGDVLVVCGSTLVVWVVTELSLSPGSGPAGSGPVGSGPAGDEGGLDGLWRLPDLTPGRVMVGGPSNAGGLFLDWVDRLVRPPSRPPGAPLDPSSIPVWQPYVRGERVPFHDPTLRGALAGLDLTQGPDELRRAAYEASAMALRDIVERAGGHPARIVVTGGGCRVPGWLQAIADVSAVPVEPTAVAEGGALGAAWLARMGVGLERSIEDAGRWAAAGPVVEPDPAWVGPCTERYGRYRAARPGAGGVPA
jgi:xylulokinase